MKRKLGDLAIAVVAVIAAAILGVLTGGLR